MSVTKDRNVRNKY